MGNLVSVNETRLSSQVVVFFLGMPAIKRISLTHCSPNTISPSQILACPVQLGMLPCLGRDIGLNNRNRHQWQSNSQRIDAILLAQPVAVIDIL